MKERLKILREKASNLTLDPGVYIMVDELGNVIYVGKAKKLKNRVVSYFHGSHLPKVQAMVDKVYDFNVIKTKNEFEALILENELIKKHMPHYNILLKDDKGYPFISINLSEKYPRLKISSKKIDDGAEYFGPFGGRDISKEIISSILKILLLPDCSRKFGARTSDRRPCLNYQMGKCDGWCTGNPDENEYMLRLKQAILLLEGKSEVLINDLNRQMLCASEELRFENAAVLRDRIKKVESLNNTQRVTNISFSGKISDGYGRKASRYFPVLETDDNEAIKKKQNKTLEMLRSMLAIETKIHRIESFDVSNLGNSGIVAAMTVFNDGKPVKRDYRKFRIRDLKVHDDYASVYQAVYRRFERYLSSDNKFSSLPDLLLIDGGKIHAETANNAIKKLGIAVPVYGMVKDDRHRTRALISPLGEEISISSNQSVFVFIGKIQEETHRFAINYQRSIRSENYASVLDKISGIGEKRKYDLLKYFKTIKKIKEASRDELLKVLPTDAAKNVYDFFHQEDEAR